VNRQFSNPSPVRRLSDTAFCAWIAQAQPGDRLEYHRGVLALDASVASNEPETSQRRQLNRLARRAWWAAQQGLVHLLQRRLGPDSFSYLAVVRPRSSEAAASLSTLLLSEAA